uniref:Uncharacterized protein n=1 Tax=Cannabis sativa TaxID=3483 RepID=A0A803NH44_CANSA
MSAVVASLETSPRTEGLSAAIRVYEDQRKFTGFAICRSAPVVSHLLFADDSLLFTTVNDDSCSAIQDILSIHNRATDQNVLSNCKVSLQTFGGVRQIIRKKYIGKIGTVFLSQNLLGVLGFVLSHCKIKRYWPNKPGESGPTLPPFFHPYSKPNTLNGMIFSLPVLVIIHLVPGKVYFGEENSFLKALPGELEREYSMAQHSQCPNSSTVERSNPQVSFVAERDPPKIPPQLAIGEYNVNVEAALDSKNHRTGLGAVIRDWNGDLVATFSSPRMVKKVNTFKEDRSVLSGTIVGIIDALSVLPSASLHHV